MTNETYLEFTLPVPEGDQDLAVALLADLGFEGFEQRPLELIAYVPLRLVTSSFEQDIRELLQSAGIIIQTAGSRRVDPQNWNATWEAGIVPFSVGRFFIRPDWRTEAPGEGQTLLIITPKMAFGTGNHETTRLILQHLPAWFSGGETVLDVGTGTGILAIAAVKSGAASAFGFDIDEWSAVNANENAELNRVEDRVQFVQGTFDSVGTATAYDVVFANLQRHIIIQLQNHLAASVKPGGRLVLSGILSHEAMEMAGLPAFSAFSVELQTTLGEWAMLVLKA